MNKLDKLRANNCSRLLNFLLSQAAEFKKWLIDRKYLVLPASQAHLAADVLFPFKFES
jgi:hypothetical protein